MLSFNGAEGDLHADAGRGLLPLAHTSTSTTAAKSAAKGRGCCGKGADAAARDGLVILDKNTIDDVIVPIG